ncbi:MAG: division/cell wall cluster transcriptional repressor MraZ, partial [Bacteroidales bacterium]|nr:division/cell wall cluster transcriptional repressor MraZ [Bacteroidales bacterium]
LNIPGELLEKAGITKEVVLSGIGYKLQIWPKETYESSLMTDDQFKLSAQRHSVKK